ncbi:MAG: hypothetical protein QXR96_03805, partial [Candidatus Woesearchaeota archaeon]
YCEGQEPKLDILYKFLPGKEKEAYNFLKEKKVVRENELEPAIRVAIKNLKDFAKPLEVNVNNNKENNNNKEIFWKWYLLSNNDAENIIRETIIKENNIKKEIKDKNLEKTNLAEEQENIKKPEIVNIIKDDVKTIKETFVKNNEKKIEQEKKNISEKNENLIKQEDKKDILTKESINNKKTETEQNIKTQLNKMLVLNVDELLENNKDSFFGEILELFKKNNVELLNYKIIRKNSDIELNIIINTPLGKLNYFCKAKDKKKIDDKELSSVFVLSQMMKLPVLYISKGDLTKKAKERLEKEFKNICFYKL